MDTEQTHPLTAEEIAAAPDESEQLEEQLGQVADQVEQLAEQLPQAPRPITMLDLLQVAILPPNGAQIQVIACQQCQQPLVPTMCMAVTGQYVIMPYCINSNCPGKRQQGLAIAGPNGDIRKLLGGNR